jgi:putative addiction module CopG family antidote
MEVKLTPDQKAFVRDAIESGRLKREEDAVQEALALWEERERKFSLQSMRRTLSLPAAKGGSSRSNPCATLRRK